jgi:large subunit ribosomal protein L4
MTVKSLKIKVYSQDGKETKELALNPAVFGVKVKESVVHQVAVAQMANARVAIAHTKTRSEVRGGGKKPWRQKGTGRARHGSTRSPIWVGGGITFGPRNDRNFSQKVNKKMKVKALFMCLSDKVNSGLMILIDRLNLAEGKTKELVGVVRDFQSILSIKRIKSNKSNGSNESEKFDIKNYKLSLLVILPKSDKNIFRAGRNLAGLKITTADSLNVGDLLKYKNIMMAEEALAIIEKVYLK